MDRESKDIQIAICKQMCLTIKETRGTSIMYSPKGNHSEVSSTTKTIFHWKLFGIASKISIEEIRSGDPDIKDQEVYHVVFTSNGYDIGHFSGFKTRDAAIENAMLFASRNGIDVDGYAPKG